jgi:hypothetical protein
MKQNRSSTTEVMLYQGQQRIQKTPPSRANQAKLKEIK